MNTPSTTCPKCGIANRAGARFCTNCGGPLGQPAAVGQPAAPTLLLPQAAPPTKPKSGFFESLVNEVSDMVNEVSDMLGLGKGTKPLLPLDLNGGLLRPGETYTRTETLPKRPNWFIAQDSRGHQVLVCQTGGWSCDTNKAEALARASREQAGLQPVLDVACEASGRNYLIMECPNSTPGFLADLTQRVPPEQAAAWAAGIAQALNGLHKMGLVLNDDKSQGLNKVLVIEGQARLADLSTCVPLPADSAQAHRAVLGDIFFLARLLYAITTGGNLRQDLNSPKVDSLPRSLQVAIVMGARGSYVSFDEMVEHLNGRNLPPLRLISGKATHPGRVRDHNEDQFFVYEVSKGRSNQPLPAFYMVADGMGGHETGEVASETISRSLQDWLDEYSSSRAGRATQKLGELPQDAIRSAIQEANAAVFKQARARQSNMGATVTAALVVGGQAYIANVGDSRTYLFRRGELKQITQDHSLVYSLAKSGQIRWEDIYTHPQRNQIYRSLGEKAEIEIDVFQVELQARDQLILCCDGLWEMVRDPDIQRVLVNSPNPQDACERLVDLANHNGGEDNITIVIVRVI